MGLKANVIKAISSHPMRWVNFTFNNRMVSPICFYLVIQFVYDGRIKCETNAELTDRAEYDPSSDTIFARDHSFGETYFDEQASLVHECTHAFLDACGGRDMNMKLSKITVLEDETIAYLAGAIFAIAARNSFNNSSPMKEAIAIAKPKVKPDVLPDGCVSIPFSRQEVIPLQTAISSHAFYKATAKETALHNGMLRPKPADSPF